MALEVTGMFFSLSSVNLTSTHRLALDRFLQNLHHSCFESHLAYAHHLQFQLKSSMKGQLYRVLPREVAACLWECEFVRKCNGTPGL